jgi:hypothetical protein
LESVALITITDKGAEKVREFFAGQSARVSAGGLRVERQSEFKDDVLEVAGGVVDDVARRQSCSSETQGAKSRVA